MYELLRIVAVHQLYYNHKRGKGMVPSNATKNRLSVTIDYRIIAAVLLLVIAVMLFLWRPWAGGSTSTRTIDVTGDATLSARPDEFIFYPVYEVKSADKTAALAELSKKSSDVIAKLKELGVKDSQIKTSTNGYSYPVRLEGESVPTYSTQVSITVGTEDLAQKVQDYLVTTAPTGSVSPQASFSETTRKKLESEARNKATQDARSKADQMADNLGFRIGKVKSVQDGLGFDGPITLEARNGMAATSDSSKPALSIQPGENELTYSVTVVYYIR